MKVPRWHEEPIRKDHDRHRFDCGSPALNEFLAKNARKNHEQGSSKTYLAIDNADGRSIRGFYSISPACIAYASTPDVVKRGLARHDVPAFRLARLAVHTDMQGRGLGGEILISAASRCIQIED